MLFLISPAKSLDYETPLPAGLPHTLPVFTKQPLELIAVLRQKAPQEIAELMSISDKLAVLNVSRYEAFSQHFSDKNARQAVFAFNGDVYEGLNAQTLQPKELAWAQEHVRILSGLYGVLRPLDWLQPYRLEMGTRLATDKGGNLYQFWGKQIADHLNQRCAELPETERIVVNLASQEYFKAVDLKALKAPVIDCVFEDFKGGKYKIISFHAKRARGLMVRWAVQHKARKVSDLRQFNLAGYTYTESASTPQRLVFRRTLEA